MGRIDLIAAEILSTEESYVKQLELIDMLYAKPIEAAFKMDDPIISEDINTRLFSNLPMILNLHRQFLAELQKFSKEGTLLEHVADVFTKYVQFFKLYTPYVNNYNTQVKTYQDLTSRRKYGDFQRLNQDAESNPLNTMKLSLPSLLICPVQRIPRYRLLLADLNKNLPSVKLEKALSLVEKVAKHINETLRSHELMNTSNEMLQNFVDIEGNTITLPGSPNRTFVRSGFVRIGQSSLTQHKPTPTSALNSISGFNRLPSVSLVSGVVPDFSSRESETVDRPVCPSAEVEETEFILFSDILVEATQWPPKKPGQKEKDDEKITKRMIIRQIVIDGGRGLMVQDLSYFDEDGEPIWVFRLSQGRRSLYIFLLTEKEKNDWLTAINSLLNAAVSILLFQAANKGDISTLEELLRQRRNVIFVDDQGWNALMRASKYGHHDMVLMLHKAGCDVNAKTSRGASALSVACEGGHIDIVDFLLANGAEFDKELIGFPVLQASVLKAPLIIRKKALCIAYEEYNLDFISSLFKGSLSSHEFDDFICDNISNVVEKDDITLLKIFLESCDIDIQEKIPDVLSLALKSPKVLQFFIESIPLASLINNSWVCHIDQDDEFFTTLCESLRTKLLFFSAHVGLDKLIAHLFDVVHKQIMSEIQTRITIAMPISRSRAPAAANIQPVDNVQQQEEDIEDESEAATQALRKSKTAQIDLITMKNPEFDSKDLLHIAVCNAHVNVLQVFARIGLDFTQHPDLISLSPNVEVSTFLTANGLDSAIESNEHQKQKDKKTKKNSDCIVM